MSKKSRHIFARIIVILLSLFVVAVCAYPFFNLQEGSFLDATLYGLNSFANRYCGFFSDNTLQNYTLVPLAVLCVLLTIDALLGLNIVYYLFEITFFAGAYLVSAYFQDGTSYFGLLRFVNFAGWQYIGFELVFLSFILITIISIKELSIGKPKKENNTEKKSRKKLLSIGSNKKDDGFKINPNITRDEAVFALTNVKIPEFKQFPNYSKDSDLSSAVSNDSVTEQEYEETAGFSSTSVNPGIFAVASLDGDLHRQALSEDDMDRIEALNQQNRLSEIFKPRNLKRHTEDPVNNQDFPEFDDTVNFEFSDFDSVAETKTVSDSNNTSDSVYSPIPAPVPNGVPASVSTPVQALVPKVKIQEEKQIVDEGSESEETPEEAAEKYRKMKEESQTDSSSRDVSFDYVSGVGGLRSSADGKYVYDDSKFRYQFPSESLLKHYEVSSRRISDLEHDKDGQTIVDTLAQFRIETQLVGVQHGPTFTLYELALAKGIRVNTVLNLADNIAMDLAVPSVRILAPIPGRSAIGIEVPNKQRDTIGFDIMMPALKAKTLKIPMVLGKTITGDSIVIDLAGTPHLLIAGTTGSGKSVCVNSLICSILYTKTPKEVRMILVDPKMVELTVYNDIPHLLTPVVTEAKKAIKVMAYIVEEMERRMSMFSMVGARKIEDYNAKIKEKQYLRAQLPYIVVVIDEFADLMMVVGKELEAYIKRITAMARFTGIHLVLATQRPSADVITGIIKSNIPSQIAFAVSNQVNSRIILDNVGAEKLLGKGDMLYASASSRTPTRIQGAYIDPEIEDIVKFVKTQGEPDYIDEAYFADDDEEEDEIDESAPSSGSEDMYMKAWKIVADRGEASASYLQRRLSIGYNRAANLIEQLEENGCIGPARGSKPREILRYPDSRSEQPQV